MSKHYRTDKTCLNCGYTVEKYYCSNCGQENEEAEPSFLHLVLDFYADIFHFDSKFNRSFKSLITRPGELTKAFIEGRKVTYIHPFRLFFFLSVILVVILEIPFSKEFEKWHSVNEKRNDFAHKFYKSLQVETLPVTIEELEAQQESGHETTMLNHKLNEQLLKVKQAGEEKFLEKHHEAQLKVMPKFYILMMPFIAFFLWMTFWGTRFNFVNHLIFSFHFVSFFIIVACWYQLLARIFSYMGPTISSYFPGEQFSFSVIFSIALLYLLLAIKRFYSFGWLRTILSGAFVFALIVGLFYAAGFLVAYYCLLTL